MLARAYFLIIVIKRLVYITPLLTVTLKIKVLSKCQVTYIVINHEFNIAVGHESAKQICMLI